MFKNIEFDSKILAKVGIKIWKTYLNHQENYKTIL
jgi:hypothetical protein